MQNKGKPFIILGLIATMFGSTCAASVQCSTLQAGSCPNYHGNERECLKHYQTSGGITPTCSAGVSSAKDSNSCQAVDGKWETYRGSSYCKCPSVPNATCTYNHSNSGCYGNGTACTTEPST